MVRNALLCVLTLAVMAVFSGCSEDETNPVVPVPTITGTWDLVIQDVEQGEIRFEITEENGAVSGSLFAASKSCAITGSVDGAGKIDLTYEMETESSTLIEHGTFTGTLNGERTVFTGTLKIVILPLGMEVFNGPFTATKR